MTEAKHTPGPWRVVHSEEYYDVAAGDGDEVDWIAEEIDEEADAVLIAAAPDMFDALQEIEARLGALHGPTKFELAEALEIARSMIAKAGKP